MKKLTVLFVATLIAVSSSSICQAGQKYISGFVGVNFPQGSDSHRTTNAIPFVDIFQVEQHDSGIIFGGAFGYNFGNGFRIEEEITYRNNDVDVASFGANPNLLFIEHTTLSFMTNGVFDIDFGIPLKPYLGAGIGFAAIERELTNPFIAVKDKDTVLAYQLMAGLGYEISPMFAITAGYRYFVTSESRFHTPFPSGINTIEYEFQSHEFMGGIRVTF